jgi:hypothetical protein
MELIEFEGQTAVIAKDQPQYLPMPAHISSDGVITCCWRLTWLERIQLLLAGHIWHQVMTFNQNLQPQKLSTARPDGIADF